MSSNFQNLLLAYNAMKSALAIIEAEIVEELPTWQDKVACGFIVQAIVQYRKETNCSIIEAKEFIDNYRKEIK